MRLTHKVALVTSSSQPGRSAHTARQLASAGASVMICGRNAAQGRATVNAIQRSGGRASFILADIAMVADAQAAIDETIATYGRLDILFNSASSPCDDDAELLSVGELAWDRITESTLKGTFFCCQYALPFLQHAGNGVIINFIEQAASPHTQVVSGVCQNGVVALTKAIAQQFPDQRVSANLIWSSPIPPDDALLPREKILYAPLAVSQAVSPSEPVERAQSFANVDEAILYLAAGDHPLQGYTLMVNTRP